MHQNKIVIVGAALLAVGLVAVCGIWFFRRSQPAVPLLPRFTGPTSWLNRGTSTARSSFETHCWAVALGKPDVLLSTIELNPSSRTLLATVYQRLTTADQKAYGSPERMLAVLWSKTPLPFVGMSILGEDRYSADEVTVNVQLQYNAQAVERAFTFHRHSDRWRKFSSDAQVTDILVKNDIRF